MKPIAIKLTVMQRIQLPGILPEVGRLDIGRACADIRTKLLPSQEEFKRSGFRQMDAGEGKTNILIPKNFSKLITFSPLEIEAIRIGFTTAEKQERLPIGPGWIELYDKVSRAWTSLDKDKK